MRKESLIRLVAMVMVVIWVLFGSMDNAWRTVRAALGKVFNGS